MIKAISLLSILLATCDVMTAQSLSGLVRSQDGIALPYAIVKITSDKKNDSSIQSTDTSGVFTIKNLERGTYNIEISYLGFGPVEMEINLYSDTLLNIHMQNVDKSLDEIVISGTMRQVRKLDSPVPVEVYHPGYFKKNPTPNIYEALSNVNGVRPQINCNVCNTGDIHINGLEGPYTMVLIDGMPIVSSLASVYGLSGIPNSLVERVEIVKGPASSLYGSEAIGGLINIITKDPLDADLFNLDIMTTSWLENNIDVSHKFKAGKIASVLTGLNYFNYDQIIDNNNDNFTDIALQERFSIFHKWKFERIDNKLFSIAARLYHEDRWGGELDWTPEYRGTENIYGETIQTNRFEFISEYELPLKEKILLSASYNFHDQKSAYGSTIYDPTQEIAFTQLSWHKLIPKNELLAGLSFRYSFYDDSTVATAEKGDKIILPGIFIQDEISLDDTQNLLLGLRYDYNNNHGSILTPRLAYKLNASDKDIFRFNYGTGFRVVNLFTEDHAALTGAREVVVREDLKPERSYNFNFNYTRKLYSLKGHYASLEFSSWYSRFSNLILPDYLSDPRTIIYDNLDGYGTTKGMSLGAYISLSSGIEINFGASLMDVSSTDAGVSQRQVLTEQFSGTWSVSVPLFDKQVRIDYTGNIYSPMLLPLLGDLDPRPEESPWWSIQNIQLSYQLRSNIEFYGGVKNLFNWTPWKSTEYDIIARPFDPFDKDVTLDNTGNIIPGPSNPYALSFDPSYVYATNQGIKIFAGFRFNFR